MIYSEVCIDETKGFVKQPNGTLKPNVLGRMVLTIEEARGYVIK